MTSVYSVGEFQDILKDLRSRLGINNFVVKLTDRESMTGLLRKNEVSINPISTFRKMRDGGLYLEIEEDSIKKYSREEMMGYIAASMIVIRMEQSGYPKRIARGIEEVQKNFPECVNFFSYLNQKMNESSKDQMVLEKSMLDELFQYRFKMMDNIKCFLMKSKPYKNVKSKFLEPETQITNMVNSTYSPPFYATNNDVYGSRLDIKSNENIKMLVRENKISSEYDNFRDLMTIKNPPSEKSVRSRISEIGELYRDILSKIV